MNRHEEFIINGVDYTLKGSTTYAVEGEEYTVELVQSAEAEDDCRRQAFLQTHDKAEACAYYAYLAVKLEEASNA